MFSSGLPVNHCCCSAMPRRVFPKKRQSVESITKHEILQLSRLACRTICRRRRTVARQLGIGEIA